MSDQERLNTQINNGLQNLCKRFAEHNQEFDPIPDIKHAVAEMNFSYTFGEDIDPKNKEKLNEILKEFSEFNASSLPDFLPWLSPLFRKSFQRIKEIIAHLLDFVRHIYFEKKGKFNTKNKVGCIGDALVRCYEDGTNERLVALGEELDLNEENVATLLTDLYGASVDTTSTSLIWAILYLACQPNIQDRLYKELSDVVGVNCLRVNDKHRLPFLEATILEILRYSTVLPLAVPHYAEHDTTVGPYRVPQDTIIFVNLWAINHDERIFKDPYKFDPSRFIDENGEVNRARFSSIPFSPGLVNVLATYLLNYSCFYLLVVLCRNTELNYVVAQVCRLNLGLSFDHNLSKLMFTQDNRTCYAAEITCPLNILQDVCRATVIRQSYPNLYPNLTIKQDQVLQSVAKTDY